MVSGGPYAEDVEARTRYRYAALSALGEFDYVPDDSEHIGYLENLAFNVNSGDSSLPPFSMYKLVELIEPERPSACLPITLDHSYYSGPDNLWFMDVVPYEWFKCESGQVATKHVLVLWLDDNSFSGSPLRKLSVLTGVMNAEIRIKAEATGNKAPELKYRILGPFSSTTLEDMIKEDKLDKKQKENLENVHLFSWGATADLEELLSEKDLKKEDQDKVAMAIQEKVKGGFRIFRTIGSDRVLTDLLVEELGLRIEGMKEKRKIQIALISEWDTVYGRKLPEAFISSVAEKNGLKPDEIKWIHRVSYMRGIDGIVPGESKVKTAAADDSKKNNTDTKEEDIERPVGRSQFDYLRRLAFRLKNLDEEISEDEKDGGGKGIQAIGVLGSDVYDKLLILQAMYKLFPNAIFFTTDIDARLLHPDELAWTQNLVIASNFGLRLNNQLQPSVPPFRDNYQTSLFLSTKIALSDSEIEWSENKRWPGAPRIFEVGRSGAFALGLEDTPRKEITTISQIFDSPSSANIHPPPPGYDQPGCIPGFMWFCLGAALLFIIVFLFSYYPFWKRENVKGIEGSMFRLSPPCFLILFLIVLFVVLTIIIKSQLDGGEPFAFFEGISIWPTEFLRFLAGGISIYFMVTGFLKARSSEKELSHQFFNPQPNLPQCGESDTEAKWETDRPIPASCVWIQYKEHTNWKRRLLRILLLFILYLFMCTSIIMVFGRPFVPYRGDVSYWVDRIAIISAVLCFILLLISVVEYTISSGWLIRALSRLEVTGPKRQHKISQRNLISAPLI